MFTNEFIKIKEHPADAARIFAYICKQFQDILLGAKGGGEGFFGRVQGFYPKVEAQGRGTLHAHYLVWLKGAGNSDGIRYKVSNAADKDEFTERLICWFDAIVHTSLPAAYHGAAQRSAHAAADKDGDGSQKSMFDDVRKRSIPAFGIPKSAEETEQFSAALVEDAYKVAGLSQLHKPEHTFTCFKRSGSTKSMVCRFGFPKEHVEQTKYTEDFGLVGKRDEAWLNSFNLGLAVTIRSNHDVK